MSGTSLSPGNLGADIGGTFTDVVLEIGAERFSAKVLTTYDAPERAIIEGMHRVCAKAGVMPAAIGRIIHGTTLATNALIERRGAKTALITTQGFRDVIEMRTESRFEQYDLNLTLPLPLLPRNRRYTLRERVGANGRTLIPLARADVEALAGEIAQARYESVAVGLIHSYLDPTHERLVRDVLLERMPGLAVSISSEVSPQMREYERFNTVVANAYVKPMMKRYLASLAAKLRDEGADCPIFLMHSGGGIMSLDGAAEFPVRLVESGPAGGAIYAADVAARFGLERVLSFDMGGTTAKICLIKNQTPKTSRVFEVARSYRFKKGSGMPISIPVIDMVEIGAGGGSLAQVDSMRQIRVGPESAGADPGPACYGRGGPAAVTDANLVLGRLDPRFFPPVFGPRGDAPLDPAASRARLGALAQEMDLTVEAAAEGFVAVAVEQMAQAVRRISTERGFDPRDHALVAFGGAAGQVACQTAEALGVDQVLCPKYGSVLSAWGIGQARMSALRQAGVDRPLADGLSAAEAALAGLEALVRADMAAQGAETGDIRRTLRLRYDGADAELPVALGDAATAKAAFEAAHQRLFGFVEPDRTILIAAVEAEAIALPSPLRGGVGGGGAPLGASELAPPPPAPSPQGGGVKMFALGALHDAPVVSADALTQVDGPALVVRADTQIALLPGWRAIAEPHGLIRLTRTAAAARQAIALDRPDPVTLELFNRRFMGVAEAMGAALERTAHSVNIKERLDFSCALFDADGGLVANAPHMPVHLGSMGASVRAVRDRHPELKAGQAFALNNPYAGGTHLPDITVVMPVFMADTDAEASFYVAARGHHADVGGIQPGSMPPFSRSIDEEGVMLDALPIMADGRFLEAETRAALGSGRWPARAPDRNIADLKAQVASCQAGAAAVSDMIRSYGAEAVARYMGFVQQNAAEAVRRAIGSLSDGEGHAPMDGGGGISVTTRVDATAREAVLDFTGSADQVDSNFNAPSAIVDAAALYVFRTLVDDDIPLNAGCLEPLKILTRPGSMLAPRPPAAVVAGNVETSQHVVDALYTALGVMANSQGSMNNFTFGDEVRQYYETICGGAGATATRDGASAVHSHMTNSRLTDPEILERRFPVRVEHFGVRHGSGGEGLHRGGDGVRRRIRFLAPMEAALLSSRREHAPQGLAGGGPGSPGRQRLIAASGAVSELPGCFSVTVELGDAIEIETPGGGGFGGSPGSARS